MTLTAMVLGNIQGAEAFLGLGEKKKEEPMVQAKKYYESREYYNARRSTQQVLEQDPENPEASQLMADILDKEIERQREHLLPQTIEEMNGDDKQDAIRTWLERSRTLYAANQYDLALFAAEKVFLYDADNAVASDLIDEIKAKALKEGKADTLFIHKMYEEEISDRLEQYRNQAEDLAMRGQFGQAQFTAEKVLMLEPEDPKALAIMQRILSHKEKTRSESL